MHRNLLRKKSGWPDAEACRDGRNNRWRRRGYGRQLRLRNGGDYRSHHDIARSIGVVIERRGYVPKHGCAGQCGRDGAASEIVLGCDEQMLAMAVSDACFETPREVRGRLYRRKISEEQQCPTDLGIVLRATLAFSKVSLHANQLDPGKGIVYKCNVLITKLATIHGDRLRVRNRVPASRVPVPEPSDLIYVWGDNFRE
jgi:hypothetical protein